ncbi:hypothetical protein ACHAWU_006007 [Discostella pseudostelligera]|uniref:2Fe-2S ferredoxin-type domain-containing protein n=1 Tax=Discostella pseudostelligera TaxID=259834 RepID=A0ABD3MN66_9STRA
MMTSRPPIYRCSAAPTIVTAAATAALILFQCVNLVSSFAPPPVVLWKGKTTSYLSPMSMYSSSTSPSAAAEDDSDCIDINSDPRLARIRLPRALGIDWGTDLSFSFVYVRDLEPTGAAFLSGAVNVGDQICELRPVVDGSNKRNEDKTDDVAINLIGASFDKVMGSFASLGRDIRDVDIVFFRGTKEELKEACAGGGRSLSDGKEKITISVIQKNPDGTTARQEIEARAGCNVRKVLTDNGINVYQSLTRWTNCKGKQLCGTCIVNITDGSSGTNRKSLDEASTLRENPDSYRLSCVTFAYGDVTVETFPPINAAQWTR